jgi:hypothetical protein
VRIPALFAGFLFSLWTTRAAGAIPPPEKLLPENTLLLVTAPDFPKLASLYRESPEGRFLKDPAMKPFVDKFLSKGEEDFLKPLQRELSVDLAGYADLPRGQATFAIIQNSWQAKEGPSLGLLLLIDTREKGSQLKTNLAAFRQKWVDTGKAIRFEKIRGAEFMALPMSSNDVPRTLRRFLPRVVATEELGAEPERPKPVPAHELVIGQIESLLVLGDSTKTVEKVVAQLTGGSAPTLSDSAAYQACHLAFFRNAPLYGWSNAKMLVDILSRPPEKPDNPQAPNPFDTRIDKLVTACGLPGLKSIAFNMESGNDGESFQFFLGIPESSRRGILKVLAGEPKDTSIPPFVPADAIKFRRWRLDGQKTWGVLEKLGADVPSLNTLVFIVDTAHASAWARDPKFDLKKSLVENLGDDLITYEKAPRGSTPAERESPPSITLLACHNPEPFTTALKGIFTLLSPPPGGGGPGEREFLGRKIVSFPQPFIPMPLFSNSRPGLPRTLSYVASGGYIAFSTDVALLEEFLRSSESQGKALRETAGLPEAAQKVTGPNSGLFGYENRAEDLRVRFESLKASTDTRDSNTSPLATLLGLSTPDASIKDWMDFSLLPAFDKVSKYFHCSVYGGSASVEGLTFKWFAPAPPQLKTQPTGAR